MKRFILKTTMIMALAAAWPVSAATLAVVGGGDIAGPAGGVVGWDVQLTNNNDTLYLLVSFTQFLGMDGQPWVYPDPSDPTQNLDRYSDLLGPAFLVLAPGATGGGEIGSFLIDPVAPLGTLYKGTLSVTYKYYTGYEDGLLTGPVDPDENGFYPGGDPGFASADASVTVNQEQPPEPTPEPGTASVVVAGCLSAWLLRRRQRAR